MGKKNNLIQPNNTNQTKDNYRVKNLCTKSKLANTIRSTQRLVVKREKQAIEKTNKKKQIIMVVKSIRKDR